jgi:aspartate kinase
MIEIHPEPLLPYCSVKRQTSASGRRALQVMKFGGTSVGDTSSIEKVAAIAKAAWSENNVVVVVSAKSGVTNRLLEAAAHAEAGNPEKVTAIFEGLRQQHEVAARALIQSEAGQRHIEQRMNELFEEGQRLCQETMAQHELTPQVRDVIASLGERLCAPLVAAAFLERDIPSEAIEATELVVTDSHHGAAEPSMDETRQRAQARLYPVLERGILPVVTGYIAATRDGSITTLGRGGSDYSATILGAVLDAAEVIIWSDVDGLMTADPRQVACTRTIREISYQEAAELANFGAKVLHPKAIRPLVPCGIPLWIRNTFAPEAPGTKITLNGPLGRRLGVKALTAISDVTLITMRGAALAQVSRLWQRVSAAMRAVRSGALLSFESASQTQLNLVVSCAVADRTVAALRREFARELAETRIGEISSNHDVAILTGVGQLIEGVSNRVARTFGAPGSRNLNIMAMVEGRSRNSFSLIVARNDARKALLALHREFQLDQPSCPPVF